MYDVMYYTELESAKKQAELDKKAIDDLVRERDILNKNMLKAAAATQKQLNLVKLHEQSKKTLEQEIQNYKEEVARCIFTSSSCLFFCREKIIHKYNLIFNEINIHYIYLIVNYKLSPEDF